MFETGYDTFKKDILLITKIDLNAYKERQMKRRIDTLIAKHGFKTYNDFVAAIKVNKILLDEFVNYLTINVSEFYRNPEQWTYLEEKVIPELIKNYGHGIRIWSAACSTGDEPYSLAMLLTKFLPLNQIHIYAKTDKKHQEYINKGLPAGQTVRIVKSMPDKVQCIYGKARIKDQEQPAIHRLLLQRYLSACQIQQEKHKDCYATVDIRPMIQTCFCLHVSDMASDHIKN